MEVTREQLIFGARRARSWRLSGSTTISREELSDPAAAISFIAVIYGIDITSSPSVLTDTLAIITGDLECLSRQLYSKINHPLQSHYSPYLCVKFNPFLPRELYSLHDLRRLSVYEGISIPSTEDLLDLMGTDGTLDSREHSYLYDQLQLRYTLNSFHHGNSCDIQRRDTVILKEELSELPIHSVVSYGTLLSYETLQPYTYAELFEWFSRIKSLKNPEDKEPFPSESLQKLAELCAYRKRPTESLSDYEIRIELGHLIVALSSRTEDTEGLVDQLKLICKTDNRVVKFFELLLSLSMSMRGWNGQSDQWLQGTHDLEQGTIDINVTRRIEDLEELLEQLECKDLLLSLPLMNFTEGTTIAYQEQEQSIGLRLEIVKLGEDTDTISSCIRISSNYLCATCYYYLSRLNIPTFDLSKLRRIS